MTMDELADITQVDPHDLKPHPANRLVYGDQPPPPDLFESISRGWSRTSVLEALPDGTLLKGHYRRFVAIQLHLATVPVHYRADLEGDEAAQVEELLRDNAGRVKTREVICREWRLAFETFKTETGSVAGEKSRDVVGKRFGISGVTLEHGIGVVNALDGRALDWTAKEAIRKALLERGVEPAWKLLRKAPGSTQRALGGDSEGSEDEQVSLAISPARRHKALLDVLAFIEARTDVLAIEETAAALPRESLDDVLSQIQNTLSLLGNLESEIRDRIDDGRRSARKSKRSR
jgi:hypothetical protein